MCRLVKIKISTREHGENICMKVSVDSADGGGGGGYILHTFSFTRTACSSIIIAFTILLLDSVGCDTAAAIAAANVCNPFHREYSLFNVSKNEKESGASEPEKFISFNDSAASAALIWRVINYNYAARGAAEKRREKWEREMDSAAERILVLLLVILQSFLLLLIC